MTPLNQRLLATPYGNINIAEGPNNGPTLFLLHGFTNRWQMFLPIIPHLINDWHIVCFDHRGHGGSDRFPPPYNAHVFYQDAEAVFNAFADTPVTLLGHSMGGSMALWLATNHPAQVNAVVTGDTSIDMSLHVAVMNNRRNSKLFSLRRRMAGQSVEDLTRRSVPLATAEELSQLDPHVMDFHAESRVDEFFAGVRSFNLEEIRCPTLLTQALPERGGILQDEEIPADLQKYSNISLLRFETGHDLEIEKGIGSLFFQAALSFIYQHRPKATA